MGKCMSSKKKVPKVESLETKEENSSIIIDVSEDLPPAIIKPSVQKSSIDFQHISDLNLEDKMLVRIARSFHKLAKAQHDEEVYSPSIENLQLVSDIFMRLGMYSEYNEAVADLLVAFIKTGTRPDSFPVLIEPMDNRTETIVKMYEAGYDFAVPNGIDLSQSLVEVGHIFRKWLKSPFEALELYQEALAINPNNAEIEFFIGVTYRTTGNHSEALLHYDRAIEIYPAYCDCYFNKGNIYFEVLKDFRNALKCYKKALNYYRDTALVTVGRVLSMISDTYWEKGKVTKAVEMGLKGIESDCFCAHLYKRTALFASAIGEIGLASFCKKIYSILNDEPDEEELFLEERYKKFMKRTIRRLSHENMDFQYKENLNILYSYLL